MKKINIFVQVDWSVGLRHSFFINYDKKIGVLLNRVFVNKITKKFVYSHNFITQRRELYRGDTTPHTTDRQKILFFIFSLHNECELATMLQV